MSKSSLLKYPSPFTLFQVSSNVIFFRMFYRHFFLLIPEVQTDTNLTFNRKWKSNYDQQELKYDNIKLMILFFIFLCWTATLPYKPHASMETIFFLQINNWLTGITSSQHTYQMDFYNKKMKSKIQFDGND